MTQHSIGIKYVEVEAPRGKYKVVLILMDDEIVTEVPAKDFHKWLGEKVREIGEWLETGRVKKWHRNKPLKADKDMLRYMG